MSMEVASQIKSVAVGPMLGPGYLILSKLNGMEGENA